MSIRTLLDSPGGDERFAFAVTHRPGPRGDAQQQRAGVARQLHRARRHHRRPGHRQIHTDEPRAFLDELKQFARGDVEALGRVALGLLRFVAPVERLLGLSDLTV